MIGQAGGARQGGSRARGRDVHGGEMGWKTGEISIFFISANMAGRRSGGGTQAALREWGSGKLTHMGRFGKVPIPLTTEPAVNAEAEYLWRSKQ